ncbi:ABC transporter permease [Aeromicrobium sp. CFBP 8757]|uniref:ABC transporter permease n=1 Tax=Aeromicrobium sp. CFBP 8757 TaxID=2775288 RepID=UPI001780F33A|nr:ABC transporter permease [Aeromicrobium sp. CFBP 8757]MBD8605525.1 ABC transporter permease [Aeromicrobium sp. CFBP 8757]
MSTIDPAQSALAVAVLVGLTLLTLTLSRVHVRRDAMVAVARAAVQLVAVALVIAWVFRHPEGVALYLGVMIAAATATSVRRIGCGARLAPHVGAAIVVGATTAVVTVLATGALEWRSQTVVPFAAQIVGGSMTAASLAGGRMRDDVARDWGQVEAWLAIGASPRQATSTFGRLAVARALVPAIDQTRSAGLVTLPGAFVGLLLGGASPAEAAEVQLLVLAGLLAAQTVAAILTVRLLGPWLGSTQPVTTD